MPVLRQLSRLRQLLDPVPRLSRAQEPRTGERRLPLRVDYDYCKGCGLCARECPTGYIAMVEES